MVYYVSKDDYFLKRNQSVNGVIHNQPVCLMKKNPQTYTVFKSPKGEYLKDSFGTNSEMLFLRVLWLSCFHQT